MTGPAYVATITSLTRGWSFTAAHGVKPDDDAATFVRAPLRYTWGYVDEQIPGHLQPSTINLELWSRSAAAQPQAEIGDLLSVQLRLKSGTVLLDLPVMRVNSVDAELVPASKWAARQSLGAVDPKVDLAGVFPVRTDERRSFWRPRLAQVGAASGVSIGCPTWWPDYPESVSSLSLEWGNGSADAILSALANSIAPSGRHHSLTPHYGSSYPSGYRYVGPDVWFGSPVIADPGSLIRYLFTPANRYGTPSTPTVSADYCLVPAKARRAREHVINTPIIKGTEIAFGPLSDGFVPFERDLAVEYPNADAYARGKLARTIETQLQTGEFSDTPDGTPIVRGQPYPVLAARVFRSDPSALEKSWTFDEFEILADQLPPDQAETLLPQLVPSFPGTAGDGYIVRHLTITDLPPHAQLDGTEIHGFITKGSLTIERGRLAYRVTTAPGDLTGNPHDTYP